MVVVVVVVVVVAGYWLLVTGYWLYSLYALRLKSSMLKTQYLGFFFSF
jgi:hypothetical protein